MENKKFKNFMERICCLFTGIDLTKEQAKSVKQIITPYFIITGVNLK